MMYIITDKVQKIADLRNSTIDEVVSSLNNSNIYMDGTDVIACNRRTQLMVAEIIADEEAKKAAAQKEMIRREAKANFHWVKNHGTWMVEGNFDGVKEGDKIEVYRVDGSKQVKTVKAIINGKALVA